MSEEVINYLQVLPQDRESVKVLTECIELQRKKGRDYQNAASPVKQADYYRLGIDSIYDMLHTKMLRILSLMETAKTKQDGPNFESMEDTLKDLINYASFGVAWLRGKVDGQDPSKDMFNRPLVNSNTALERYAANVALNTGSVYLANDDVVGWSNLAQQFPLPGSAGDVTVKTWRSQNDDRIKA